jgi:hypothetical protein
MGICYEEMGPYERAGDDLLSLSLRSAQFF